MTEVTNFALATLSFNEFDYQRLPAKCQELIRIYCSREWRRAGKVYIEVADHRVDEILVSVTGFPMSISRFRRLPDARRGSVACKHCGGTGIEP